MNKKNILILATILVILATTLVVALLLFRIYIYPTVIDTVDEEETIIPLTEEEIEEQNTRVYYSQLDTALVTHEPVYRLEMANQELEALPIKIGELTELRILNLSNNNLTELPVEIGNLSKLTTLLLSNNNLTELPIEIGNLTELRELFLSSNNLTSLPDEIANLKKLQTLLLTDNNFTKAEQDRIKQLLPDTNIVFEVEEIDEDDLGE